MTAAAADGTGIDVRSATVTYRNGHTALVDASFAAPAGATADPDRPAAPPVASGSR